MKKIFLMLTVLLSNAMFAQNDLFDNIYPEKSYDYANLITTKTFQGIDNEGHKEVVERGAILGAVGDNYTRWQLDFTSVKKDSQNPYIYNVAGNTKIGNGNFVPFTGTFELIESKVYKKPKSKNFVIDGVKGKAKFKVHLDMDKKAKNAGSFDGEFTSKYILTNDNHLLYDGMGFVSDSFNNNYFTGHFTDYKTKKQIPANFGDFRIPNSGDLDIGAAEFSPNKKYIKNGWENYNQ
ncbi:hypothetical protein EDM00_07655 [Ornithobacterium rhinotracheale]|nr:hypothetical protein [Ornithobacterium rhinotracheale]MRI63862.1 hypothetical protein [Ornithobacterium rhinotracheale]